MDKKDNGKLEWDLLPKEALEEVIKVMMYGNTKYEKNNWKTIDNLQERYWNAAQRHLWAHKGGEYIDKESKLPHVAHAAASLMFMLWDNTVKIDNDLLKNKQEYENSSNY